jgi:hypothetical protein
MQRCRLFVAAGAAFLFLLMELAAAAQAAQPCDKAVARNRLGQLREALQRPESMAAMDAAKADFAQDQDFDNEANAKYLAAAMVYFKIERYLDGGAIAEACQFLAEADGLINQVVAGK